MRLPCALSALLAGMVALTSGEFMESVSGTRQLPDKDRWNLSELYAGDDDWEKARAAFQQRIAGASTHKGHLGESASRLLTQLTLISDLQRELERLSSYARMKLDLDTREPSSLARAQEIDLVGTRLRAASSYLAPEILALPDGTVERFLDEEPRLRIYAHPLREILRQRPHTLTPAEEKLLADASVMASTSDNVYGVLANAELPWPTMTLSTGETVRLNQAAYVKHRTEPNRSDRLEVFRRFFGVWDSYARTFGVTLDAEVKKSLFFARSRRYETALEAALDRNHIPAAVYDAILSAANEALPSLHRYFRLQARMLGVEDLAYHDIYAPLVPASSRRYTVDEAKRLVLEAVSPLGPDYAGTLGKGLASRWVDFWPSPGKRSGAYSNGSIYGEHPFILMNFTENFDGVSTLAHEVGHAMHSFLANAAQPYPTADYSIFVAEVASTFNEALLYRHAVDRASSEDERLSLLASWLDAMRGTFFRQAMFAEFERSFHDAAERGETLTGEKLSNLYLALLRRYHGSSQGVCAIDDLYKVEWAYIPHFYANYYVYQYTTGFAASTALARRVMENEPGAREAFLDFLRAGGSDHPYELLKRAGVDLATPGPYRETVAEMNRVMDEVEAILAKSKP